MPSLFAEQLLELASRLLGLTVKLDVIVAVGDAVAVRVGVGVTVGTQLHNTEAVLAAPLKENTAQAGQVACGTETLTCIDRPDRRVPLGGLK